LTLIDNMSYIIYLLLSYVIFYLVSPTRLLFPWTQPHIAILGNLSWLILTTKPAEKLYRFLLNILFNFLILSIDLYISQSASLGGVSCDSFDAIRDPRCTLLHRIHVLCFGVIHRVRE